MTGDEEAASGVGLATFDSLRAEEEPWLAQCYVPLPDFDLVAGSRSYLIRGEEGSGKTALFQALRARLAVLTEPTTPPRRLTVEWRPRPVEAGLVGSAAAAWQLEQVLAGCADALLAHLSSWPGDFYQAPADIQQTLTWFICHFLVSELGPRVAGHSRRAGDALLGSLSEQFQPDPWLSQARLGEIVGELVKSLRGVGLQGAYILVSPDTVDPSPHLAADLKAFLSSLTLFENPHFVYKLILPESLAQLMDEAGAVDRRRIAVAALRWSPEDLSHIVTRRIGLAVGQPISTLAEVCADAALAGWLQKTGGDTPRGWLLSAGPLVARYLQWQRPVTAAEWQKIREASPPPLTFDEECGTITVGWRKILVADEVPEIPLALFRYLYERRGRLCTRQELYYRAYLPAAYPDAPVEAGPGYPEEYDRVLESTMSRLRKLIEPDARSQLYLVTERGRGYRLINA